MAMRPRIQRCFVDWLEAARPRLSVQPRVTRHSDRFLEIAFDGLTPAISAYLGSYDIDVWVEWDGHCWDVVFHAHVVPAGRRSARICDTCPSEAHSTYANREALWRDHLFETFLFWVNETLAPASVLALYQSDSTTWVKLLCQGDVSGERSPDVVLPLRIDPKQP